MRLLTLFLALTLLTCSTALLNAAELPRLKVSDNHRYLQTEDGKPFFWLGDTAWELIIGSIAKMRSDTWTTEQPTALP